MKFKVPYSIALKLKNKNYGLKANDAYDDNGNIIYNAFLNETPEEFIPAPHINDVLLWLETEKNIYITSIIGDTNKSIEYVGVIYYGSKYQERIHINDNISRNEAFLKCIDYVIDNLI